MQELIGVIALAAGTFLAAFVGTLIVMFKQGGNVEKIAQKVSSQVTSQVQTSVSAAMIEPTQRAAAAELSASQLAAMVNSMIAGFNATIDVMQARDNEHAAEKLEWVKQHEEQAERIDEYTKTTADLLKAQNDMTVTVDQLKATDAAQQRQIDQLARERDAAYAERDDYKFRADAAEIRATDSERERNELREKLAKSTQTNTDEIEKLKQRITALEELMNALSEERDAAIARAAAAEQRAEELERRLLEITKERNDAIGRVQVANGQAETLRGELKSANERIEALIAGSQQTKPAIASQSLTPGNVQQIQSARKAKKEPQKV